MNESEINAVAVSEYNGRTVVLGDERIEEWIVSDSLQVFDLSEAI